MPSCFSRAAGCSTGRLSASPLLICVCKATRRSVSCLETTNATIAMRGCD